MSVKAFWNKCDFKGRRKTDNKSDDWTSCGKIINEDNERTTVAIAVFNCKFNVLTNL